MLCWDVSNNARNTGAKMNKYVVTELEFFNEFLNYFTQMSQSTYQMFFLFLHDVFQICDEDKNLFKIRIENMRRNLQKQGIMKSQKIYGGKGNITTIKTFDEEKVKQYRKWLIKKEKKNV